jgi:hypothetical protein|tara:strand:+ start:5306 stop:7447 length:2142 start_codon:yes stop_codon:yes gene_type:complete
MKKFFIKNKINFLFLFISFICIVAVLGIKNISFQSTAWLYGNNDASFMQLGWYFFQNDIWRFPLGSNPNYGEEIASSIVYTDSIPILAFLFKSIRSLIPGNFQYFSFWYFLCFFFQLFFSFKILKKFTNSDLYSLVGSIFFLIAPIFIFKINWHGSAAMGGLLLCTLYLGLTKEINESKLSWIVLIIVASLIEYSSMLMIIVVYSFLRIINFTFDKKSFFELTKDFFLISSLLLFTLYITGYFEIRMGDTLGIGFGVYKLNLLSPFDSFQSFNNIAWSRFLPDIKLTREEELESFNYFGLGQILMLLLSFLFFLNNNYKKNLLSIRNNKKIKAFILISVFMTLWALSNKVSFGSYTLIEIPLNKYIFAALSLAKNTGRMFWIVNYFLLILSIIIIYNCFEKKVSLSIISLFLIIQATDVSVGIKSRINFFTPVKVGSELKDPIWENLFEKYKVVKTTYPISWPSSFIKLSYAMEKYNIEKTNLVIQARINRKTAAEARYNIYDSFIKKNLSSNAVYIIDNPGHLRHLKHLLKNENIGFFYRDNIWFMVMNEKERMNDNDKKIFSKMKPKLLEINKRKDLNFRNGDGYYGFGWSHNINKPGIWSEGPLSTLLFRTDKNYENLKLEISCKPYITKKNNVSEFDIYVNDIFNQSIKLVKNDQDEKIEILINEKIVKKNEIKVDFKFKNPVSPYEVFESPDSRKLGILVKNIKLNSY